MSSSPFLRTRRTRKHGLAVLLAGLVTVTAACATETKTASDDTTPTTDEAPTTVAAAAATESSVLDTTPATTAAPTTVPPTTVPETTVPPTPASPPPTVALPPANRIAVAAPAAPFAAVGGANGEETARIQQRLLELGFWLAAANGSYDLTTLQAVMAFQKYAGLDPSGNVDDATAATLGTVTMRAYGYADAGTMIEIDKTRQLIFFLVDGHTQWVFNTSTGNGEEYIEEDQNTPGSLVEGVSLTPDGLHRVNRERPEGWWEGDLGQIYRPKYFVGGVAIHGSNSVPNYPASHGCVRVTLPAMDFIWDAGLMPIGLPVWVHEQAPPPIA